MVEGLPSNHAEEESWKQPGRGEGEPCSDRDLMAQVQDLILVPAWIVCPLRHDVPDSVKHN